MHKKNADFFTGRMFFLQFRPALLAAVTLALGDIADAIVLGQKLGVNGLAAIGLSMPVFMLINTVMHGFGIGGSIRFSAEMAQGQRQKAVSGFQGVICVTGLLGIILAILGNLFLGPLLAVLGVMPSDGEVFAFSRDYLRMIVSGTPLLFISYLLNYYLRNDDNQKTASIGFIAGSISDFLCNLLLVLVFDMGARGAGLATIIGNVVAVSCYLPCVVGKKSHSLGLFPFKPDFSNVLPSFRLGISSSSQYLFSFLFIIITNNVLMRLDGNRAVGVFDVVQNASFFMIYIFDAAARSAQPLLSTYWSEQNRRGRKRALQLSLVWGMLAGIMAIVPISLFSKGVCTIFGLIDPAACALGCLALRTYSVGAVFMGLGILFESYFQSCGDERAAFTLTVLRSAVMPLSFLALFSSIGSITAFWLLYPCTEFTALAVFWLWNRHRAPIQELAPGRVLSKTIDNQNQALGQLLQKIEEFCEQWEANPRQSYFVIMTVEELCAAIMEQAFQGQKGFLQVTLIANEDKSFSLHIRDSAVSFDPFSMKTRRVQGGDLAENTDALGVMVIKSKAEEFSYRRYQGFNTLIVKI